jgi:hypothetical protein
MKNNNSTNNKLTDFRILGIRLPLTMDLSKWGNQFYSQDLGLETIIWIRKKNSNNIYKINQSQLSNKVNLIQSDKGDDNILISFIDTRKEGDPLNTFIRSVNLPHNKIYNFKDGKKLKL